MRLLNANVSLRDRMSMHAGNRLKLGLFGANCSSGRAVTKVPERWSGTWPDNLRLARMADAGRHRFPAADRTLEGLWRRDRLSRRHARDHHLGNRAAGGDQANHLLRHGACPAVPSHHRGQGDGDRRPDRRGTLRAEHRRRLERGRVRDVRRRAARSRSTLRLCAGMDRRHQADLVRTRGLRFRRPLHHISRGCAPSPSPMAAAGPSS